MPPEERTDSTDTSARSPTVFPARLVSTTPPAASCTSTTSSNPSGTGTHAITYPTLSGLPARIATLVATPSRDTSFSAADSASP
jgi:hypothetical protein